MACDTASGRSDVELYSNSLSPFARLVRVALIELAMEEQLTERATMVSPADRNVEYAKVTPLRLIPSMRLADGTVLYASTMILLWLNEASGGKLLPAGPEKWPLLGRYDLAHGLLETAVNLRYERLMRPEELRWQTWIDDRLDKIERTLEVLAVSPTAPGAIMDMAEIGLGCALGYLDFRFADLDWRGRHPDLRAWWEDVHKRPSFARTPPPAV